MEKWALMALMIARLNTFRIAVVFFLLALASALWLEVDPFAGRADEAIRSAVFLWMILCAAATAYYGALTWQQRPGATGH
jgi:hypothetical protein